MGNVTSEESVKDAGLFQQPLPASDSSSQVLIDIFGTSRTITINGKFSVGDTGYATIALFIAALDALANGAQSAKTFVSGRSGVSYTVLVTNATWKGEEGSPNQIEYTITMVEGSA